MHFINKLSKCQKMELIQSCCVNYLSVLLKVDVPSNKQTNKFLSCSCNQLAQLVGPDFQACEHKERKTSIIFLSKTNTDCRQFYLLS